MPGDVYFNENDPYAAQWLRNLIAAGLLPAGEVDERSIVDVRADDLTSYRQCHFFAGIGGWILALALARWPREREIWSGSCPCQPFSGAGKQRGAADERHLWPVFAGLIRQRRPATVVGEQVASKLGRGWLAGVRADMEDMVYAFGAADLCAAGVRAPHIRQRLWWVAERLAEPERGRLEGTDLPVRQPRQDQATADAGGPAGGLADTNRTGTARLAAQRGSTARTKRLRAGPAAGSGAVGMAIAQCDADEQGRSSVQSRESARASNAGTPAQSRRRRVLVGLGDTSSSRQQEGSTLRSRYEHQGHRPADDGRLGNADVARSQGRHDGSGEGGCADQRPSGSTGEPGFWDSYDIVHCTDGKARRFEPGSFPLAHGVSNRVGLLRGYGNAVVPACAAEFIKAYLKCRP